MKHVIQKPSLYEFVSGLQEVSSSFQDQTIQQRTLLVFTNGNGSKLRTPEKLISKQLVFLHVHPPKNANLMIIDAYEQSCLFYITSHDIFPSYTHHIPMISPPAVALFASPPAACFPRIWEISGKEMEVLIRTWRVINWKYGKNHRTKWELFHQAMFDCRRVKMECEMAWLWPVLTPHDKKQTVCDHDLTLCYF